MDRLDAMQLFVRVAELGSFSAVAQQLNVARSVVTRQIAALEAPYRPKFPTGMGMPMPAMDQVSLRG